ncbi:transposase family protein, partial [Lactococcus termiticola]
MFDSIMKEYQLQEKYWHCEETSPVKVNHHYELFVRYEAPQATCPKCQGITFHRHGSRPRKIQLTEFMGSPCFMKIQIQRYQCTSCESTSSQPLPLRLGESGQKDSVLLKKQILGKLRSKISISEAAKDLNVSNYSFYRLL